MVSDNEKKLLFDIQTSISEIESFVFKSNILTEKEFCDNIFVQRAVERCFQIIGEALARKHKGLDKRILSVLSISNQRKIIDFANKLDHAYDQINPKIIWLIIKEYLPTLKTDVNQLLE